MLSSEPGMREPPRLSVFDRVSTQRPVLLHIGGKGPSRARIVCCFLGLDDRPFNPMLGALPRRLC